MPLLHVTSCNYHTYCYSSKNQNRPHQGRVIFVRKTLQKPHNTCAFHPALCPDDDKPTGLLFHAWRYISVRSCTVTMKFGLMVRGVVSCCILDDHCVCSAEGRERILPMLWRDTSVFFWHHLLRSLKFWLQVTWWLRGPWQHSDYITACLPPPGSIFPQDIISTCLWTGQPGPKIFFQFKKCRINTGSFLICLVWRDSYSSCMTQLFTESVLVFKCYAPFTFSLTHL